MSEPEQHTTVGKVASFLNNKRVPLSTMERANRQGEFPYYGAAGLLDHVDDFLFDGLHVLVGEDGSVVTPEGHPVVQLVGGKFWVNNHAHVLRMPTDEQTRWLYYALRGALIAPYLSGSVQPKLSKGNLSLLPLNMPTLDTQQAIASALGALDDKISSNRHIIDIAEELGSAILEAQLELDAFGFPAFDDTRRLGDLLEVLETGLRPKGGASADGTISLGAENVESAGVDTAAKFKFVPTGFAAQMKRGRLQDGDVLVYKDGGKPGNFVPHVSAFGRGFPVDEAVINEHVYRVRARAPFSQGLLYWLLRSRWMDQEMRKRGTGVAIPGLNSTNFRDLPIPSDLSLEKIDGLNRKLDPMLFAVLRAGAENRRLASLRDVLLPELLSGRIGVSNAGRSAA